MEVVNLYFAWAWMLAGMLSGAVTGLFFHNADWLGGYGSWRRRMVRLGHVAFFGTGLLNLGFALTVERFGGTEPPSGLLVPAAVLFVLGAIAMPAVCYAAAWRTGFRHLFVIPVLSLIMASTLLLIGSAV